jgi:hypothetical protein
MVRSMSDLALLIPELILVGMALALTLAARRIRKPRGRSRDCRAAWPLPGLGLGFVGAPRPGLGA